MTKSFACFRLDDSIANEPLEHTFFTTYHFAHHLNGWSMKAWADLTWRSLAEMSVHVYQADQ